MIKKSPAPASQGLPYLWLEKLTLSAATVWFLSVQLLFFLILKQLLACPPNRSVELRPSFADPHCCAKENRQTLSLRAPPSANEAMIPKSLTLPLPPPGAMAFEDQVRCKQIQYTLHCSTPRGSQRSYSGGTNHSGSRFACFFSLYLPGFAVTYGRNTAQPPAPAMVYVYLHLNVSD